MRSSVLINVVPTYAQTISPILSHDAPIAQAILTPHAAADSPFSAEPDARTQLALKLNGSPGSADSYAQSFESRIKAVRQHLEDARAAREKRLGNWESAVSYSYTSMLGALTATVDGDTARPSKFYRHLIGGEDLYLEAALGASVFVSAAASHEMLTHLGRVRDMLKSRRLATSDLDEVTAIDRDIARVKLMRAYLIMQYADHAAELTETFDQGVATHMEAMAAKKLREKEKKGEEVTEEELASYSVDVAEAYKIGAPGIDARHEFYENAATKIKAALRMIEVEAEAGHDDMRFVGRLLMIEALARQADCSYTRGDPDDDRRAYLDKLQEAARRLMAEYAGAMPQPRELVASYLADVARMFARMGAMSRALWLARAIVDQTSEYQDTSSARKLLRSEEFKDVVDDDRSSILSDEQLKMRVPLGTRVWKCAQAGIANAHSKGFLETLAMGSLGAAGSAIIASAVPDWDPTALQMALIMGGGAAVVRSVASAINGLQSEEAQSVFAHGLYERSIEETARDVARLMMRAGIQTGLWTATSAFVLHGPEISKLAWNTLGPAVDLYWRFIEGVGKLFDPATYQSLSMGREVFGDGTWLDAARLITQGYEASAGLMYLLYCISPRHRERIVKYAKWFIPGAVMLGADLGMLIAGTTDDYWNRIGRSSLALVEGTSAFLTAGLIALSRTHSPKETLSSIWTGVKNANHVALVAIAITVGVSSALGGLMQRGERASNILMSMVQGGMITVGLLPITLFVSGILKRNIAVGQGFKEGWQDSKGEHALRRIYEVLAGGVAAFGAMYPMNRVGRAIFPWLDWPTAGLRTMMPGGWDSNMGYGAMMAGNALSVNPHATTIFPETGGTDWERDALQRMYASGASIKDFVRLLFDHWHKAGLRMALLHMFYPHAPGDRMWPLFAIRRIWDPPKFPMLPNAHYFASFLQLLLNKQQVSLTGEQMDEMLKHVATLASHPRNYEVMRPVVQTLYLARSTESQDNLAEDAEEGMGAHGRRIRLWFQQNPWIVDLLNIDRHNLQRPDFAYRRKLRAWTVSKLKLDHDTYLKRVRAYAVLADRRKAEKQARKDARMLMMERLGDKKVRAKKIRQIEEELKREDAATGEGAVRTRKEQRKALRDIRAKARAVVDAEREATRIALEYELLKGVVEQFAPDERERPIYKLFR